MVLVVLDVDAAVLEVLELVGDEVDELLDDEVVLDVLVVVEVDDVVVVGLRRPTAGAEWRSRARPRMPASRVVSRLRSRICALPARAS